MLVKNKEFIEEGIEQLKRLLSPGLSLEQKFLVERELRMLQSARDGEMSSTHFLNFYYQDSPNWAVLHDLNIENNGSSAQFDHILINRQFNLYAIESKNFSYGLKITADGEFLVFDGKRYQHLESPIEQRLQQMEILETALCEKKIMPKRMGIHIKPKINCYILFSPKSEVVRPPKRIFDSSMVIKANILIKNLLKKTKNKSKRRSKKITSLSKKEKKDPLIDFACRVTSLHCSSVCDYHTKFSLEHVQPPQPSEGCPPEHRSAGDYCI
jgi:hypothetical protein